MKNEFNTCLTPGWQVRTDSGWNEIRSVSNVGYTYMTPMSGGSMIYGESSSSSPVQKTVDGGVSLFLDRSRFSNYSQIPNLTYTIAITGLDGSSERWAGFSYDAEHSNGNRAGQCNVYTITADNARVGVYHG